MEPDAGKPSFTSAGDMFELESAAVYFTAQQVILELLGGRATVELWAEADGDQWAWYGSCYVDREPGIRPLSPEAAKVLGCEVAPANWRIWGAMASFIAQKQFGQQHEASALWAEFVDNYTQSDDRSSSGQYSYAEFQKVFSLVQENWDVVRQKAKRVADLATVETMLAICRNGLGFQ